MDGNALRKADLASWGTLPPRVAAAAVKRVIVRFPHIHVHIPPFVQNARGTSSHAVTRGRCRRGRCISPHSDFGIIGGDNLLGGAVSTRPAAAPTPRLSRKVESLIRDLFSRLFSARRDAPRDPYALPVPASSG